MNDEAVHKAMDDMELVAKALAFAHEVHAPHRRKGMKGDHYMVHILEVKQLLEEDGALPAVIAAGIAHDTTELGQVSVSDVNDELGHDVADMVVSLTDPHYFKHLDSLDKKQRQAARMKSASTGAKKIRLADCTSNLRSIVDDPPVGWSREKCLAYIEGCKIVADTCKDASPHIYSLFLAAYQKALNTHKAS